MQGIVDFFKRHAKALTITGTTLLLITVLLTFWTHRNIFDTQRFTDKSMEALSSQTARDLLAADIVDQAFENRPILNNVVSERATALTSSLLGTDIVQNQMRRAVFVLNKVVTTEDDRIIELPLQEIIEPVNAFLEKVAPESVIELPEDKQSIVILDASDVYNVSSVGQALLYVGPIALIALLATAIVSFVRMKNSYEFLSRAGAVLLMAATLTFIITYTSGAVLTLQIIDPERSALMQLIYDVFVNDLRVLLGWMFIVGLLLGGVGAYKTGRFKRLSEKFS